MVADILERHDWRRLGDPHDYRRRLETAFALPADYDRMPLNAKLYASSSQTPLTPIRDPDQLVQFTIDPVIADPGVLGHLRRRAAYPAGARQRFDREVRLSKQTMRSPTAPRAAFTADADSFDLDPRLLTLGLIWRWRAQKRLEYAEDLVNFENAVTARAGRDKGARILKIGVPRYGSEVNVAYPGTITP